MSEDLAPFFCFFKVWWLVAAFPAANSHSSEGALDSVDFCDCLLCFRGAVLDSRREKAHFGKGSSGVASK